MVEGATFIASPNFDQRPSGIEIDVLVIHAISLPPGCYGNRYVEALFTNQLDPEEHAYFREIAHNRVSSHFYIRRDGELLQFVASGDRAWHAGESEFRGRKRVNDFSIGIELEGCDEEKFEEIQYAVLCRLTLVLQDAFPAIRIGNIVGHCDISPGRKTDPGPHFNWPGFLDSLSR